MSQLYDLPDAKQLAINIVNTSPEGISVRDLRRLLDKEMKKQDPKSADVKVDLYAGVALIAVVLSSIVFALNT